MIIKTLAKSIRQYKKQSILSATFMLGEVVMEVLVPFFMAFLIDKGIIGGDMGYIAKMGTLLAVFAMISLIFGVLSGNYSAKASTGLAANLRHDTFSTIQTFSFSNIDKFSTSSLVTRLTTDVTNVMIAYQAIIRMAVRSVAMVSFAMFMAFRTNATVALVFVFVVPFLAAGLFFIIYKAHPLFVKALKTYDELNNVVQENLHGIRVVKSFVREEVEKEKFGKISSKIFSLFTMAQKCVSFNSPLIQLCTYTCIITISWIGARLIVSHSMSTGELMSMFSFIMQILMNLMMLSMVFVMIIISRSSAERIVEVLHEQPDLKNADSPTMTVTDGSISFQNVSFSYVGDASKACLSNINIDIKAGETIGIIGGTGSSKSTFVQLIPRLYDATVGQVLVGGRDVREIDVDTLRNAVAVVLQQNVLFSGTISENLRWGNEHATDEEIRHACVLSQADGFIEAFPNKYDTYIEQGGTNVSGGQRQRLCIARALLKKPKILILDDSTSAVDTKTDAFIRRSFKEEIPDTTKIIITQRIASVMDADRIIVMDDGLMSAIGTHEELMNCSAIYKEVFDNQTQGVGDFDAEK